MTTERNVFLQLYTHIYEHPENRLKTIGIWGRKKWFSRYYDQ